MKNNWKKILLKACTVTFVSLLSLTACGNRETTENIRTVEETPVYEGSLKLQYATQFSVEYYSGGYVHIHIEDGNEYVLVPRGARENTLGIEGAILLPLPCEQIYLAASSAMDFFSCLGGLDQIVACSTRSEDYASLEVRERIDSGQITYVGKYSAPEYETILGLGCDAAIESTMIYHSPKIKEQLQSLKIPVLVERSSYEEDPLGRLEWIKLYGVLLQKEEEAEAYFDKQCRRVEELKQKLAESQSETLAKKVAFFYLASNGYVNIRKPGDYLSKMIETAGGSYAFSDLVPEEENALSTLNINWEDFYKEAVDADILIYNGTIDGGVTSLQDLLAKNALFADFKAVREKRVWCTNANLFQESSKVAEMIEDLYKVIGAGEQGDTEFIHHLE